MKGVRQVAVFITSDWHFCHNKEFLYKPRGFECVASMNQQIIQRANEVVGPNDDLYVLGDLMLDDMEEGIRLISSMPGKLHIVRGNHDSNVKMERYSLLEGKVVEIAGAIWLKCGKQSLYLSHFPTLTANSNEGHFNLKTICVCGHTHTKDRFNDWDKGMIYHAEVDAHDLRPVSVEQIVNECRERYLADKEKSGF